MNVYKISGRIGQGAHGIVMKATNTKTNREVALKRINYRRPSELVPMNVFREILCLKLVDHHYVVELLDVFTHSLGCVLVFDFMPSGLAEMIQDDNFDLDEAQIKSYMLMLLSGISHIHSMRIMHRDLKPANLLIDKCGILKIADFGLGRLYHHNQTVVYSHQVATRWYRAPELLYSARHYDKGVDLWSIGCIFAEMINRTPLFAGENDIEQLALVLHNLGTPTEETWPGLSSLPDYNKIVFPESPGIPFTELLPDADPEIVDLISQFVCYDSSKRPTAIEAMNNAYFFKKPTPCPLNNMPKPRADHRRQLANKPSYLSVDTSMQEIFTDLSSLISYETQSCSSSEMSEFQDELPDELQDEFQDDSSSHTLPTLTRCSYLLRLLKKNIKTGCFKSQSLDSLSEKSKKKKSKLHKSLSFLCFTSCTTSRLH